MVSKDYVLLSKYYELIGLVCLSLPIYASIQLKPKEV